MSKLTNKKIAILKGGPGSEREVSLATAAGVAKALRGLGADVSEVDVTGADFVLPEGTEIAFNAIHGTFGEDGEIQRILEERGVAYTGEGVEGSKAAFDKILSKKKFIEHGVPTPGHEVIKAGERPAMGLPCVVKAPREGSSVGVYIVKTDAELEPALRGAAQYSDVLLVEQFVKGRELTVGILGDLALPVIEIRPMQGFYDFKNKYPFLNKQGNSGADHLCPAPLDPGQTRLVQETALAAHRALGLRVYSRVDVLLPENGGPSVLEINTIPGMTEASLLPEAAAAAGISYAELCERIIELSLARPG
ncbi:MAG TPA: D-alanine--D-alanine ligase [Chthoniobacteraceae bacterium]|nr:D-alanine--D-alanine ligase [Chthoniobacteraceae bacterium]